MSPMASTFDDGHRQRHIDSAGLAVTMARCMQRTHGWLYHCMLAGHTSRDNIQRHAHNKSRDEHLMPARVQSCAEKNKETTST